MKKFLNLISCIIIAIVMFSCSNDNSSFKEHENNGMFNGVDQIEPIHTPMNDNSSAEKFNKEGYDIDNIGTASTEDIDLIETFLTDKPWDLSDFEEPKVVTYTNLAGKSIVLTEKNGSTYNENFLILPIDDKNQIISYIAFQKNNIDAATYEVSTKLNGQDWFDAEVSKVTNEVTSFQQRMAPPGGGGFISCVLYALISCANDGECAFLCGIVWEYCIGAIVIACAVVSI